ncbi:hypothetical protein LCGC14_2988660 [marine sediment metagenome]|uniref:Uncharacterized protein n=1 Tax=marine sediment metagenome TaxID=412755 RepID=A0A0F8XS21_9ZZZZ
MSNWRPKELKNPFSVNASTVKDRNGKYISHHDAWEYGVDAILEALRKMGIKGTHRGTINQYGGSTQDGNTVITHLEEPMGEMTAGTMLDKQYGETGTLVFIPNQKPPDGCNSHE